MVVLMSMVTLILMATQQVQVVSRVLAWVSVAQVGIHRATSMTLQTSVVAVVVHPQPQVQPQVAMVREAKQ